MRILMALILLLSLLACNGADDDPADTESSSAAGVDSIKAEPVPTDTALAHPGDAGDGSVIMVNGRAIRPAGALLNVRDFPANLLQLATGEVVVSSLRNQGINIIDGAAFSVLSELGLDDAFYGLAANAAGDKLWVSGGGRQKIYEFSVTAGVPTLLREISTSGYPMGIALTSDESKLLVCSSYGSRLYVIDLTTLAISETAPASVYPYDVVAAADGVKAYISNWGSASVTVVDISTGERLAEIAVGHNPEAMTLSPDGSRLYVADSDSDTISVINTSSDELVDTYDVWNAEEIVGASPLDVAITADGGTLYIAAAGLNAVVVMNAATGAVDGMIPAGYYPTAVLLDEDLGVLYVTNGKGGGIPVKAKDGVSMAGTLQQITIPSPTELADYTQTVTDNLTRTELFWQTYEFESPIPTEVGAPSEQIKHVIFIMRENKTYDQELSDIEGTERDPNNLVFGEANTPNTHQLARTFTNCDNYYSEANVSNQGHMWSVMMYSNDYNEKTWASGTRSPLVGVEPAAMGGKGTIFEWLIANDINFRVYGQVSGTIADNANLAPYVDFKYGFWNLGVSDETKAGEIIREMEAGIWPEFVYISLHNDHTNGTDAGQPTIPYFVGDNDAGLGKLIEYIMQSDNWSDTAIFITEDDPQSGADHVDPHRTIALVISPWAKTHYTSSVLYSMSSIWLTIELILGIPPMSVYDDNTSPMYDAFTMTPNTETFTAVPNPIPLEFNPKGLPMADYCARQNWAAPDQVRRLGEVIWKYMRPGQPWPEHLSVDSYAADEREDETEEAREYRETVEAMEAYALAHGLWDGSRLPTIKEQFGR